MVHPWVFTLLALAVGSSTTFANTFTVTVEAINGDRKPVAKADVALFWNAANGAMKSAAEGTAVTGLDGKAVLRVDDWNERRPVLVLSADRTLGAIIGVSKADDGKEVIAPLGKTVRVRGKIECKELNQKPPWVNTMVTVEGFRAPFVQNMSTSATFEFMLPAGKYTLRTNGTDVETVKQTVTVDHSECDLGTTDMKATPMAKLRGKTLPDWVIADARGVKSGVKLSDYRGKWVYIEFWGFW
jgi:hypothetical protein